MLARIYDEMLESVAHLEPDVQARVIFAYARYQVYGELPDSSDPIVFSMVKAKQPDLDNIVRDINCSRVNWRKWGKPKKTFQDVLIPIQDPVPVDPKKEKKLYLDFVRLTDGEYEKLIKKFWESRTKYWIERLNSYIGQIGTATASRKYKSHYHTILNWDSREWGKTSTDYVKEQAIARQREKVQEQINEYLHPTDNSDVWENQNWTSDRREQVLGS